MSVTDRVEAETAAYIQQLTNITREPNGYNMAVLAIVAIVRLVKSKHGALLGGLLRDIEAVILKNAGA